MKVKLLNKYSVAAMLLIATAACLVTIALITTLGEFVSAAFVISGLVCVITGIFLLTFSGGEPVDPHFVAILPVQGCINLCRIASDLGINGNAYFLPFRLTGETRVMQFNPETTFTGGMVSAKGSFPETGQKGLLTVPSCDPLIQDLRKRNRLVIPNNQEQLIQLFRETAGEIFELAPKVSVNWNGSRVTITLHRYRFIDGCRIIAEGSRDCCTRNPCPVSSLFGVLITEGTGNVVMLEHCLVSASHKDVIITCSVVSVPDPVPHT